MYVVAKSHGSVAVNQKKKKGNERVHHSEQRIYAEKSEKIALEKLAGSSLVFASLPRVSCCSSAMFL